MKIDIKNETKKILRCRSYKNFTKKTIFLEDLKSSGINSCESVKDPNAAIKLFTDCFVSSVDTHAPLKERHIKSNQPQFLNKKLKKAIWLRKQYCKKFLEDRSSQNWEAFRTERNKCVDIRRRSIRTYFQSKFTDDKISCSTFWKTVEPS